MGYSTELVCAQNGSPLPSTINFQNLISTGTTFASTRITEGFAGAFQPLSGPANLNAQTGERFLIQYSGFPAGSQLFVPNTVAGSDALQPTAGGDLELPASGGSYAPSASGSLLLALVIGAGQNGAGGAPVYVPAAVGSPAVTFNSVSELSIVNGSAYAVYEVVDANLSNLETAQFPTFLGLTPDGSRPASQTTETVTFAPVSTVTTASSSAPVPRFSGVTPPADCTILGDCTSIFGQLSVSTTAISFTGIAGGATTGTYFYLTNAAGGLMQWTATVSSGAPWLTLDTGQGVNNTAVRVYASPVNLTAGTYTASITINAGIAGSATIPVTYTVTAPTPAAQPGPKITSILNAASLAAVPAVPGSLSTIMGSGFSGKDLSVTFDGEAATILFSNDTQINLLIPADLASKSSTQLVVTANGTSSAAQTVSLASFEPAIFAGGILNQDSTVNSASNGAAAGSVIALWATGLSGTGTITGNIAGQNIATPYYAGPAPGLIGVQQVNLLVPGGLAPTTTQIYVCGNAGGSPVCSIPVPFTVK